jgi:hypothetical protein
LLFAGVAPVLGAVLLLWLLVESVIDMSDPENSYTGQSWFGVGPPLVIGITILLAGLALMAWWRSRDARYWRERPGAAEEVQLTR